MQQVWKESISQASSMIEYQAKQDSINSIAADTRTISLHVMSGAIFGKSYPFRGASEKVSTDEASSYGKALKLILDCCILLFILGRHNLGSSWLPKSLRDLHQATLVFQGHMTEAFEVEKQNIGQETRQKGRSDSNLMTALVRAAQDHDDEHSKQDGLKEEEVYGNIFVFNFAGHDATANSLAIGICLLAARPTVQDWITEEINTVLGSTEPSASSYSSIFPRLPRCLAVVVSLPVCNLP